MKRKLKKLFLSLKSNSGDAQMDKMIIIAIAFVAGTLILAAVIWAINGNFRDGIGGIIRDILH